MAKKDVTSFCIMHRWKSQANLISINIMDSQHFAMKKHFFFVSVYDADFFSTSLATKKLII